MSIPSRLCFPTALIFTVLMFISTLRSLVLTSTQFIERTGVLIAYYEPSEEPGTAFLAT